MNPIPSSGYKKWVSYGQDPEIFTKHADFCSYLEQTKLLSQLKITREVATIQNGEPGLNVQGKWMSFSQLKSSFSLEDAPNYREKFLIHKTSHLVYTILDNGKGLQPHHPYLTERNAISSVNEEEYAQILSKAREFTRPGETSETKKEKEEERSFVIQIASSYVDGSDWNVSELLYRRKHPYVRIIIGKDNPELGTKKGEVYEVGYGWKQKPFLPLIKTSGQFRSPDVWEYMPCQERVVTNIPISQGEAHTIFEYTTGLHRDGVNLGRPIGFHMLKQNCSSYINALFSQIGIEVPTRISLPDLIGRITPDFLKSGWKKVSDMRKSIYNSISNALDSCPRTMRCYQAVSQAVRKVAAKVFSAISHLFFYILSFFVGEGLGKEGRPFVEKKKGIFDAYQIHLPGVLQEWQRQQPSTVVYKKTH